MNKQEIEKAIEIIKRLTDGLFENGYIKKANDMAISALTQQLNNGWIPVSEKLPTSDGRFEVTIKSAKGKRHVEMCDFHKDAHFHNWGGKWNEINVVAWRRRPEPYKIGAWKNE